MSEQQTEQLPALPTKNWWESRTIWLNAISTLIGIATAFHINIDLSQAEMETVAGAVMSIVGVATIVRRFARTTTLAPTPRS